MCVSNGLRDVERQDTREAAGEVGWLLIGCNNFAE